MVPAVVVERFDHAFAARTPASFAHDILRDRLRATAIVVGWDFRFGRGRAGDADGLRALSTLPVHQVEVVQVGGAPCSSSRIRQLVARGDVREAAALLSRPHCLVGDVVRGRGRGRTLGFPTANLALLTQAIPNGGVFACLVRPQVDAPAHPAIAHVGERPTFADGASVEVHLLDFHGDLYGARLRVDLVHRIRGTQAFAGPEALIRQIRADIAAARAALA